MATFSIHPDILLGPVHLTVSDLGRSLNFYEDVLGFRVLSQAGGTTALTADGETPLVFLTPVPGAARKPPHSTGLYHFAILLPSRVGLSRSLRRLGDTDYPLGGCSDHSVSEALYLDDPDGNGIEIYWDRPRSGWPQRNRKVAMTTDPLDLVELLEESEQDEHPWEGLPAETCIGHVHLHVADLSRAVAFYQDALGFEVMSYQATRGASFLSAGGYHHQLGLNVWAGQEALPPPDRTAGIRYFTVCLPDEAELGRLAAHLESVGAAVTKKGDALFLRDPSENGVVVLAGSAPDALLSFGELESRAFHTS